MRVGGLRGKGNMYTTADRPPGTAENNNSVKQLYSSQK